MLTKVAAPQHPEFEVIVSQNSFDRFIRLAFSLSYFATMGTLVTLTLCPESAQVFLLLFVMTPVAALAAMLITISRLLRIAERQSDRLRNWR